jgi:hypothetical protein
VISSLNIHYSSATDYFCQQKNDVLRKDYFCAYNECMSELKKLSFGFTPEDDQLLTKLKDRLKEKYGSLTNIAVIRIALRELDRQ